MSCPLEADSDRRIRWRVKDKAEEGYLWNRLGWD